MNNNKKKKLQTLKMRLNGKLVRGSAHTPEVHTSLCRWELLGK
jgi:hypothetical protein